MRLAPRLGATLLAATLGCVITACGGDTHTTTARSSAPVTSRPQTSEPSVSSTRSPAPTQTSPTPSIKPSVSQSAATRPVKAIRTITVGSATGRSWLVTVWAQDSITGCQHHAYGAQMIAFLTATPCLSADRQLLTTELNGRQIGISAILVELTAGQTDLYVNARAFKDLVTQDGTGSIADMMRDGYRLPSGPAHVPSPDAFSASIEDNGVEICDLWYLSGATPNNAPELVTLGEDLFLATWS